MTGLSTSAIVLKDGHVLRLRAISPADQLALIEMGRRSTGQDLRLRFLRPIRAVEGNLSKRLSQVDQLHDYVRAAFDPLSGKDSEFFGVGRLIHHEDGKPGEFAIMVRSDMQSLGMGHCLMENLLRWAAERGWHHIEGFMLPENLRMMRIVEKCGGLLEPISNAGVIRVLFKLPG
ncbi:MAG: GNAT family N-acetyltransferase [Verrucomicrobia bacterium]|nr:GNAT family N-acetyltransferase [Verrucomicrobiota bacterium]